MRFFNFGKKSNPVAKLHMAGLPAANWTAHNFKHWSEEFFARNIIAYKCITTIAANVATIGIYAQDKRGNFIENYPALKLLESPNKMQSQSDFIEQLVTFWLISGNAYAVRDDGQQRQPVELWPISPQHMTVKLGDSGLVESFKFSGANGSRIFTVDQFSGASPVFHWKRCNPLSMAYGLSPMHAAGYSIDIHNEIARWNKATMQNNAKPSGALVVEGNLTDEQYNRQKNEIESQWMGANNAHRPLLLEAGLKWQPLAMTPSELDYIANKQDLAREICQAFGFPPLMLGLKGDNTYANYAEARLSLWEDTVLPTLDKLLDALNRWMVNFYGDAAKLVYDRDTIPALEDRRYAAFEKLQKASFLTINEKRELAGFPPIDDGDNVMVSASEIPLGYEPNSINGETIKNLMEAGLSVKEAVAAVRACDESA